MTETLMLNPYIYYRRYMDELFMFDTKNKRVYQFNDSAADMIDIVGKSSGLVFDNLVQQCADMYDAPKDIIASDATVFINMLYEKDILKHSSSYKNNAMPAKDIKDNAFTEQVEHQLNILTGENKLLSQAILELTYRCNEKCIHCYAIGGYKPQQEMSTSEWFDILDQLADANVLYITFTGGEVFTREDFIDIFDYAIDKRFLVDIYSNGYAVTDEHIKHIAQRYPGSFQSSIYGDTAALHDSITQVEGSFEKTLSTMRKFKEHGVSLVVKTVMMKRNAGSYEGMKQIAEDLGAAFQMSLSISPTNDCDQTPVGLRIDSSDEMKKLLLYKEKDFLNEPMEHKDHNGSLCGAGFKGISINPSGKIFMCNGLGIQIGDCREESIADVWSSSPQLKCFRAKRISDLEECVSCNFIDYCQFCPGIAIQETGCLTKPYSEACFIAKMRYEIRH